MHNREERLLMIDLASEQPDMSEEQELAFYEKNAIRTKADLLVTISEAKEALCVEDRKVKENPRSDACYTRLSRLFDKFHKDVESMFLMEPLSDWWGYGISVRETGISLKLCHFSILYDFNRERTEEYPSIGQLTADEDFTIHITSAKLLSLDEFGEIHNVAGDTVRQWIRRGKIRSAVKLGSDWRIPELSDLPERGYKYGSYYWKEEIPNPPEDVPDINDYDNVFIRPTEGKGMWVAMFGHEQMDDISDRKFIEMNGKQKEKLELYLISHPLVLCPNNYLGEIYQRYPLKYRQIEARKTDPFQQEDENE